MALLAELKRRNVLRVAIAYLAVAWLLTEVAGTLFPMFGYGDAPARIVVIILAIGFPLFLVFSWVFEITPEGLKREVDVASEDSIKRFASKKLDRAIIVLLVLVVGYFAVDKFVFEPVRDAALVEETAQQARSDALVESYGDQSIAVLPFVNMSADPAQEYFSDGISEELLNLLAQTPDLRVISRSSAFSFKGMDVPIPEVARRLNVAHVLEGSVRKDGDRVRITAQLIEARSDTHLWSDTFDRQLDDIFAVQEEIAATIGDALRDRLVGTAGKAEHPAMVKASNVAAYDAYLQARELIHRRTERDMAEAYEHLRRSLRLDEGFAPAHAQMAIVTMMGGGGSAEAVVEHLDRALELEPDLAEAHAALALLELQTTRDPVATIEHARRALASNPSYVDALNWLQIALESMGYYRESDATLEQMSAVDPLNIIGRYNHAIRLAELGQLDRAHEMADQLMEQSPAWGYNAHADISLNYEGRIADGLAAGLKSDPGNLHIIRAFIYVGEYAEARRIDPEFNHQVDVAEGKNDEWFEKALAVAQEFPGREGVQARAARALYEAGRIEEALPFLERAYEFAHQGRPFFEPLPNHKMMWLAHARRLAGDEAGAQAAAEIASRDLAARRDAGRVNHEIDQAEALLAAFENNPEGVLAAIGRAVDHGLRDRKFFMDPLFKFLSDSPRFLELLEALEVLLETERGRVLQLICHENPVPDEWQPMPETCDGVEEAPAPGVEFPEL